MFFFFSGRIQSKGQQICLQGRDKIDKREFVQADKSIHDRLEGDFCLLLIKFNLIM